MMYLVYGTIIVGLIGFLYIYLTKKPEDENSKQIDKKPDVQQEVKSSPANRTRRYKANKSTKLHKYQSHKNMHDDELGLGDAALMMMFPDLAPFMHPQSMLAWYLWFQDNEYEDNSFILEDMNGIPGFDNATEFSCERTNEGVNICVLDSNSNELAQISIQNTEQGDQITSNDSVMYISNESDQYEIMQEGGDDTNSFSWGGEDGWTFSGPISEETLVTNDDLDFKVQEESIEDCNTEFESSNEHDNNQDNSDVLAADVISEACEPSAETEQSTDTSLEFSTDY
jgi:hypothetical protein